MARPSKNAAIDYATTHDLTYGLLERAACPDGLPFVLVKDADKKGLRLRVTKAGGKHWQFETRLRSGQLFTRALGEWPTISVDDAKTEAHRLRGLTEKGIDPRDSERQQHEIRSAATAAANAQALTVRDIWPRYLAEGRPKRKDAWKPGYRASLDVMSAPGGVVKKRGQGLTRPGPLYPLLALKLADVTEDALQVWFEREAVAGKHQATRALMMFRGFLRWCSARPEFRKLIDRDAGKAPAILENLPSNKKRTDVLGVAQLPGWWHGVEQLTNRTASVYLKALVLTGARKEELAGLTWVNVDFQWRKLTLADKVEQTRTIPLTPYLAHLLATLPRVNAFVFASASKAGRISDARSSHKKTLQSAGIDHLTFHGLRRTFTQRGRSVVPAGAVAQIAGHKPSATAEGYAVLPLDDLRPYAALIEARILEQAGIKFDVKVEPGKLQLVVG
jgi:site-specific recombinase XerD